MEKEQIKENLLDEAKTLLSEVHDTAKLFRDYIKRSGDANGINSTYHRIMYAISLYGQVTACDLVRITNLKPPTISLMIKNIEGSGLITREIDVNDQRNVNIKFTDLGKEMCTKNIEFVRKNEIDVEKVLTDEERKIVSSALKKLREEIKKKNENIQIS